MALKNVDAESYVLVRTYINAGAAVWDKWAEQGGIPLQGPAFLATDPSAKYLTDQIFQYIPRMTIVVDADPNADNCPTEAQRLDSACVAMRYDVVFDPINRQRMLDALNARTPADLLAEVQKVEAANPRPKEVSELEWWVVLVIGVVSYTFFPGAGPITVVSKIMGFILTSWAVYGLVTIKTPEGKGIFDTWSGRLSDGFNAVVQGAASIGKVVIGVGVVALLWAVFGRGR